jgi:hypothetical protein
MLERTKTKPATDLQAIPHVPDGLLTEADHALAFNQSLGRTVSEIIFRGLVLISLKQKFPGAYERVVKDTLNCSRGYAYKNKTIAENEFFANASNWKHLPPSVAALYRLAGICPKRLQILADDGAVHAKLTIDKAVELAEAEKDDYLPTREPGDDHGEPGDEPGDDHGEPGDDDDDGDVGEIDSQQLLIDAEDVGEELKAAFALCRRRIDAIETHGDPTAKALLVSGLREFANSITCRADALDPRPSSDATENDGGEIIAFPQPEWSLPQDDPVPRDKSRKRARK